MDNRSLDRYSYKNSIQLSFGSQITITGQIRDLSSKSAFVNVKSMIHLAQNDKLEFSFASTLKPDTYIKGSAHISRVSPGDGIAIYFTEMDKVSSTHLDTLVKSLASSSTVSK